MQTNSNYFTFDYQSGSVRRDLIREAGKGQTEVFQPAKREVKTGLFTFIRNLFK